MIRLNWNCDLGRRKEGEIISCPWRTSPPLHLIGTDNGTEPTHVVHMPANDVDN